MNLISQFIIACAIYSIGYTLSHVTNLFHYSVISTLLGVIVACIIFVMNDKEGA